MFIKKWRRNRRRWHPDNVKQVQEELYALLDLDHNIAPALAWAIENKLIDGARFGDWKESEFVGCLYSHAAWATGGHYLDLKYRTNAGRYSVSPLEDFVRTIDPSVSRSQYHSGKTCATVYLWIRHWMELHKVPRTVGRSEPARAVPA
jgi:hypothetical protein